MSLKENLSKIAKSAADGAKVAAKKSGDLVEVTKLNMEVSSYESEITKYENKLGKVVFDKVSRCEINDIELMDLCRHIENIKDKIEDTKAKILQLKKLKVCSNCNTEVESEVMYCPKCGFKVEAPKPEKVSDDGKNVISDYTKICDSCNAENPPESEFCSECGNSL